MSRASVYYRSVEFDPPRIAPEPTPKSLKSKGWRKRTGFDNIMTPEDLELERPVRLGRGA